MAPRYRYDVDEGTGEIIDTIGNQIVSLEYFDRVASEQDREDLQASAVSQGLSDDPESPADESTTPEPDDAATPAPVESTDSPTFDEYMAVMRPRNPDTSDKALKRDWAEKFGNINPKELPTWHEYEKVVTEQNPGVSRRAIRQKWEEDFGDFGADEKPQGFGGAFVEGMKGGFAGLKEALHGTVERLQKSDDPMKLLAKDAGDAMAEEAKKHTTHAEVENLPWYQYFTNPEALGNLFGNTLVQTAPTIAGAVVGGVSGGPAGAAAGIAIVTYFQQAGSRYRSAYEEAQQQGLDEQAAHDQAYNKSGVAGLVSGVINALAVPATLWAPLSSTFKNVVLQYVENVAIDTGDEATQNLLAERPVTEGLGKTLVASATMSAPETMTAVKMSTGQPAPAPQPSPVPPPGPPGVQAPPAGQVPPVPLPAPAQSPVTPGTGTPQQDLIFSAITDPSVKDIGTAIQRAFEVVDAKPSEAVEAIGEGTRAAAATPEPTPTQTADLMQSAGTLALTPGEFIQGAEVTTLEKPAPEDVPGALPTEPIDRGGSPPTPPPAGVGVLKEQPPQPADAIATGAPPLEIVNPTPSPIQQEMQRARGQAPSQAVPTTPQPAPIEQPEGFSIPEAAEPQANSITPKDVHATAYQHGFDPETATFREYTKAITGKAHLDDMTPEQLQAVSDRLTKLPENPMTPPATPTTQPTPKQAPLLPTGEQPDAVTSPRNELPEAQSEEMLLRAEKAQADVESGIAVPSNSLIDFLRSKGGVQDQGSELSTLDAGSKKNLFQKNVIQPTGMTLDEAAELAYDHGYIAERDMGLLLSQIDNEVRGIGQAPDWYVSLTEGPKAPIKGDKFQTAHEKIDEAIAKIIQDEGVDRGKAVEAVKAALLNDREFAKTPWGRELTRVAGETENVTNTEGESLQSQPFLLTNPTGSKPKTKGPEQLGLEVPPPTIGERPIIAREVAPETAATDAPLFSQEAQTPAPEQTTLPGSPTDIIAKALRSAADQIAGGSGIAKMAKVEGDEGKAQAGWDPRVLDILGGNLYHGDLGKIATKEMIQNAVDSVRPFGKKGKVTVRVDTLYKTIKVSDNGLGMARDVAMKEFIDIGGSKKPDGSSGGFGLAKVAIFTNASNVKASTRVGHPGGSSMETTMEFTGQQWAARDPIDVNTTRSSLVPGTDIEVTIKPTIEMSEFQIRRWMQKFVNTQQLQADVTMELDGIDVVADKAMKVKKLGSPIPFEGGTVQFYASEQSSTTSSAVVEILNNGLPQFTHSVWLGENTVQMPNLLIADIRAAGTPEEPNYPFTANREQMRSGPERAVDNYVVRELAREAAESERDTYRQVIKSGPKIQGTNFGVYDTAGLHGELPKELAAKPYVKTLSALAGKVFKSIQDRLAERSDQVRAVDFYGIGLGSDYLGVNIAGKMIDDRPNNIVLLNPYVIMAEIHHAETEGLPMARSQELTDMASYIVSTLVHEISHQNNRGHGVAFAGALTRNQGLTIIESAEALREVRAILASPPEVQQQNLFSGGPDVTTEQPATVFDAILQDYQRLRPDWVKGRDIFRKIGTIDDGRNPSYTSARDAESGTVGRLEPEGAVREGGESEAPDLARSAPVRGAGGDGPTGGGGRETGNFDPGRTRASLKATNKSFRPFLLGALTLNQLADVYGDANPETARYNRLVQEMKAEFIDLTNKADPMIRRWDKLKVDVADRMSKIMEEARFENYDPDGTTQPANGAQRLIKDQFKALPDNAKGTYREVRDFYRTLLNARFQAIVARIDRAGGSDASKKQALQVVADATKKLSDMVYFPLTRFGEHVVIAKQIRYGKEVLAEREVHTFEAPAEADRYATVMRARGFTVKQTTTQAFNQDPENTTSDTMRKIEEVINGLPGAGDFIGNFSAKAQLIDALRQIELQALPDLSHAKHFIHAKNVRGASRDALRAFAHSALHGAHHIARIKYADQLGKALATMDARIKKVESGDVTAERQLHNELVQRHGTIVNPQVSPVAAFLGQLGFTMSLGGVVATGVTNMTQVPLVTLPWLGSRFGYGKTSAALARAYKDFLDPNTLNLDSLFDASKSKRLTDEERRMLKELQRQGKVDLTQTMDLSGRAAQDNLSRVARQIGTKREWAMRMLGFTFHAPEVMNRQVTGLATFRLAKGRGLSYDAALSKAAEAIDDTHFIYTQENRARYMSGNVMRVLTMFKQYGQHIAYTYGRAAALWLAENNVSKADRAVAKKQLLSMFGLQLAAAGVLGVPFFGTVASLFNALLNGFARDDDEEKDWEIELRKILAEHLGQWPAEVVSHGASRLTPWDMSARLGQQNLFIQPPKLEREGRAAAMDWATSLGGPVVGYGVNGYLGVEDLVKGLTTLDSGHFLRGVEELVPAVLRHGVKSLRYELEGGVRTRNHYKQLDLSAYEKLGQLFGFTPSRVAEMYTSVTAVKQQEHRIITRRHELLDAYAAASTDRDEAAKRDVLEEIKEFNGRNDGVLRITSETLMKSRKGRQRREAGMERGVYLPKTRRPLRQEGDFANF